jgi:hypothetical protein
MIVPIFRAGWVSVGSARFMSRLEEEHLEEEHCEFLLSTGPHKTAGLGNEAKGMISEMELPALRQRRNEPVSGEGVGLLGFCGSSSAKAGMAWLRWLGGGWFSCAP